MRLQQPDDDNGSMLLTVLPNEVVHRIDGWSPLAPAWKELAQLRGNLQGVASDVDLSLGQPLHAYAWPDVPQRQTDADQGNRDGYMCSTCGESYLSLAMLRRHVLYNSYQDPHNGLPAELCHKAWPEDFETVAEDGKVLAPAVATLQGVSPSELLSPPSRVEVEQFLQNRYMEVVVVLEGIEQTTSCTVQARHSYVFPEEVAWNMDFAGCVHHGTSTQPCTVDLDRFHEVVPVKVESPAIAV